MLKILWISNRLFTSKEETKSGVWLKALAIKLSLSKEVELANITCLPGIATTEIHDFGTIKQWVLPKGRINKHGYPNKSTQNAFEQVVKLFKPDIIQVWGSENPIKLLPFEEKYPGIKVLSIQGVLGSIGPVFLAGLSSWELLSTIGVRELLYRSDLLSERRSFYKEGKIEEQMIKRCRAIITQSEWTDSQIRFINPEVKLYRTERALRPQFLQSKKWLEFKHPMPVIYSAAVGYTIKGLHILIRALARVKTQFPNVELRLAGAIGRRDFLGVGYFRYILKLIKKLDLEKNVTWLGPLNATQIVKNLQEASVFVNPSCVESYSLTLAEAMSVGTPSVVSFAGAMPELAENNIEALFFTLMDHNRCADQIIKLLSNYDLSAEISRNSVLRAESRNNSRDIVKQQIDIYSEILRCQESVCPPKA
jgi:glycosyltransferase involved in cell wall biosynthesis